MANLTALGEKMDKLKKLNVDKDKKKGKKATPNSELRGHRKVY